MIGDAAQVGTIEVESDADVDGQLAQIFAATFPELPEEMIRTASVDTLEEWDSLQSITLRTLLEEQFGIAIPPFDQVELDSFAAVRAYVLRHQACR